MTILKHMGCLDMRLLVLKVTYSDAKKFKAKVKYVNAKGDLLHPDTETVEINKADMWKRTVIKP